MKKRQTILVGAMLAGVALAVPTRVSQADPPKVIDLSCDGISCRTKSGPCDLHHRDISVNISSSQVRDRGTWYAATVTDSDVIWQKQPCGEKGEKNDLSRLSLRWVSFCQWDESFWTRDEFQCKIVTKAF